MKKPFMLLIVIGLFLFASCQGPRHSASDKKHVMESIKAFDNSFIEKDRDLFLTAITTQPELIAFGAAKGEHHLSREALINAYDREMDSISVLRLDRTPLAVQFSPDGQTAWVVCLVEGEVQFGERTVTISDMRSTMVLEKQEGRWVIVHAHSSLGFESNR